MQEALSCLQAMGAVSKLPDDVQWSIRALLMRRLPNVAMLPRISAPAPGADPALPQLLGYLLQQMSKVLRHSLLLTTSLLIRTTAVSHSCPLDCPTDPSSDVIW